MDEGGVELDAGHDLAGASTASGLDLAVHVEALRVDRDAARAATTRLTADAGPLTSTVSGARLGLADLEALGRRDRLTCDRRPPS